MFTSTSLGGLEVLDAHSDYQAVHRGSVRHRVELAVRVVEDVARVVPQAEVLLAHQFDGLAALGAGGVLPAVRLNAEANAFRRGVIAAFRNGLVVELEYLLVARPAQHQVRTLADGRVINKLFQTTDARFERAGDREVAIDRQHLKAALPGGVVHRPDLLEGSGGLDHHPLLQLLGKNKHRPLL